MYSNAANVNLNTHDDSSRNAAPYSILYIKKYNTAEFWAEKAYNLSKHEEDLYWYGYTLNCNGNYHRSYSILSNNKLNISCTCLMALTLFKCKNFEKALELLNQISDKDYFEISQSKDFECKSVAENLVFKSLSKENYSSVHLLKGKIFEAIDNLNAAKKHFILSLYYDPTNYESFELLLKYHLLSNTEAQNLVRRLENVNYPEDSKNLLLKSLIAIYENIIEQTFGGLKVEKPTFDKKGSESSSKDCKSSPIDTILEFDTEFNKAEKLFYKCLFQESFELLGKMSQSDPYNIKILILKVSILYHLENLKDLFMLAHSLINIYPTDSISWYAVACYYLLLNKFEISRFYINKALSYDKYFGPAWVLLGHSYSMISEHDQAMATYYQALKYVKKCHLIHMYIGLEYSYINNHVLALNFLLESSKLAPHDPVALHELGIAAYNSSLYPLAWDYLQGCLKVIDDSSLHTLSPYWEPLYANLGHLAKKLKRYDDSLVYFRKALMLRPKCVATYASMGLVYALKFESMKAIDLFTKGLSLKKDDTVCTIMLNLMIQNFGNEEFERRL